MALADIEVVKKRLIALLNANQSAYVSSVSGDVGAFPYDEEITEAVLEADNNVCVNGYFASANDALSNRFNTTSGPLGSKDNVPFHHGALAKTEVSKAVLALTNASVNLTTDVWTSAAHGLATGDVLTWRLISGALPTSTPATAELTNYFAIKVDANTFKVAASLPDAMLGTAINFTAAATGVYELISWQVGVQAANLDDILNAIAVGTAYVGADSFSFLYRVDSGLVFTPARYARVTYPVYNRTGTLQAEENETTLLVAEAMRLLAKNASPALFGEWSQIAAQGFQQLISDSVYTAQMTKQGTP